jgi:type IV fimbrial biogenesis protein FimT
MVVVVLVSVLAVIAIPAVSQRMRDRRVQAAAQEVSTTFRNARLRALGRGSAVMVRFNTASTAGTFEVREAVRGAAAPAAQCAPMPTASCTDPTAWDDTDSRRLSTYTPATRNGVQTINFAAVGPPPLDPTALTQMDVCFTPMGRTFARYNPGAAFQPLAGVPLVRVWRNEGLGAVGLERVVFVPPNGAARLGIAR